MSNISTQSSLNIADIRNGILITRDGKISKIIEAKPVNFALKSEDDKNALIGQFQSFLNSLSFPIQILVQSRKIDISPYLAYLKQKLDKTENQLMRLQVGEYMAFIDKLTQLANIMDKKFFVVVSYTNIKNETKGLFSNLAGGSAPKEIKMTESEFEKNTKELEQRVATVTQSLATMEIQSTILSTQKIIELYYGIYNPQESLEEHLVETSNIQAQVIQSEDKNTIQDAITQNIKKEEAQKNIFNQPQAQSQTIESAKPATQTPTEPSTNKSSQPQTQTFTETASANPTNSDKLDNRFEN